MSRGDAARPRLPRSRPELDLDLGAPAQWRGQHAGAPRHRRGAPPTARELSDTPGPAAGGRRAPLDAWSQGPPRRRPRACLRRSGRPPSGLDHLGVRRAVDAAGVDDQARRAFGDQRVVDHGWSVDDMTASWLASSRLGVRRIRQPWAAGRGQDAHPRQPGHVGVVVAQTTAPSAAQELDRSPRTRGSRAGRRCPSCRPRRGRRTFVPFSALPRSFSASWSLFTT